MVAKVLFTDQIRGKDNLSGGAGKNSAGDFKKHSKRAPYKKS